MDGYMDLWMYGWLAGWVDRWMHGWMGEWMDGWLHMWIVNVWIGGWLDGCVYGWVGRRVNERAVPLERLFTKRTWSSNFHMQEKPQCELVKIRTFWGVYPRDSDWVDLERNLGICIFLNKCHRLLRSRVDLPSQILIHLYFYIFSLYCPSRHHCIVPSLRRRYFQIHLKGSLEGTWVEQVSAAWGSSHLSSGTSSRMPLDKPGCTFHLGASGPGCREAWERDALGMNRREMFVSWTQASPRGERASRAFDQHIPVPIGGGISGWPLHSPSWWLNLIAEGRNLTSVGCPLFSGGHLMVKERGKGPRVLDQGLLEG